MRSCGGSTMSSRSDSTSMCAGSTSMRIMPNIWANWGVEEEIYNLRDGWKGEKMYLKEQRVCEMRTGQD